MNPIFSDNEHDIWLDNRTGNTVIGLRTKFEPLIGRDRYLILKLTEKMSMQHAVSHRHVSSVLRYVFETKAFRIEPEWLKKYEDAWQRHIQSSPLGALAEAQIIGWLEDDGAIECWRQFRTPDALYRPQTYYDMNATSVLASKDLTKKNMRGQDERITLRFRELKVVIKSLEGISTAFMNAECLDPSVQVEGIKPTATFTDLIKHFRMVTIPDIVTNKKEKHEEYMKRLDEICLAVS